MPRREPVEYVVITAADYDWLETAAETFGRVNIQPIKVRRGTPAMCDMCGMEFDDEPDGDYFQIIPDDVV